MTFGEWKIGKVNGTPVKYRIVKKQESTLMKIISWLLFWQRQSFMQNYYTTIGRTIYTPSNEPSCIVLEHELVHIFDYQKWSVLFSLSYLFCLPLGWTMRAHWERRAYSWQIAKYNWADKEWLWRQFGTATYLFMWPSRKAVDSWVDDCVSGKYSPIKSVEL